MKVKETRANYAIVKNNNDNIKQQCTDLTLNNYEKQMKRDSRKDPTVEMKCRETFNKFRKHTALSSETLSRGIDKEFPEANTQYKFEPEFENLII